MENLDVLVLRTLLGWRKAGQSALLATVVRTWGSSPRPVGSIMALAANGSVVGSVSGGCIEDDLIYRYTRLNEPGAMEAAAASERPGRLVNGLPQWVKYGISADEAHRFGLPCGGTLELLLEFDPAIESLEELVAGLGQGQLMSRTVRVADGAVTLEQAAVPTELTMTLVEPPKPQSSSAAISEVALIDATEPVVETLTNTFGPEYRMLLIGAGQLTEYMATMALFNGFAVTVCDPREEYRASWSVPNVVLTHEMPDDVVREFKADRRTCVIALTHDPKLDDLALLEALETEAFYVGAIGSRRNNDARQARMIEHFDQTEESLKRLRGPIGIYIGSKLPSEIAVSVMAEVLAVKNGVPLPRDMDVATAKNSREIAGDTGNVCAIPFRRYG
jgi:xanthine dehydrogenase accessory factor